MNASRPYPAYRPSGVPWLDDVPENWVVRRFGTFGRGFNNGTTVDQLDFSESAHLVSRIETISDGSVNYTRVGYLEAGPDYNTYLLKKDDFLISHINSYSKVGNSARYKGEKRLIHGMNLIRVTPLNSVVPVYLEYVLKSNVFIGAMQRACKPAINQVSVTTTAIKAIPVPLPPLPEQAAIVRYLDYVDRRIRRYVAAKRKLIALLEEEKQAVINQAVTRGLDPNVRLKPSGVEWLGDVPEHWEVVRNGQLFVQRNETGFPELPILEVSLRTGVNIRDFEKSDRKQTMAVRSEYKRAVKGDIAYNMMRMWQGAVGVAPVDGLVSPAYVVAKPLRGNDPRYFSALFRTSAYMAEVDKYSRGIVKDRNRLYWEDFKLMPTPCPPLHEQVLIADAIDQGSATLNDCANRIRWQIELLQEYRTRLIADVVTGKLDVREAAAELPDEADGQDPRQESSQPVDGIDDLYDTEQAMEKLATEREVVA